MFRQLVNTIFPIILFTVASGVMSYILISQGKKMIKESQGRGDLLAGYQKFVGYFMIFVGGLAVFIGMFGVLGLING
jgi:hypothetical protein